MSIDFPRINEMVFFIAAAVLAWVELPLVTINRSVHCQHVGSYVKPLIEEEPTFGQTKGQLL